MDKAMEEALSFVEKDVDKATLVKSFINDEIGEFLSFFL
jgi:hypothetical protein